MRGIPLSPELPASTRNVRVQSGAVAPAQCAERRHHSARHQSRTVLNAQSVKICRPSPLPQGRSLSTEGEPPVRRRAPRAAMSESASPVLGFRTHPRPTCRQPTSRRREPPSAIAPSLQRSAPPSHPMASHPPRRQPCISWTIPCSPNTNSPW
jgi:hypothetical protein